MARYSDTVRDQNAAPIPGVKVYVALQDGSTPVLTTDGGEVIVQPIVSDEYGSYYFNASDNFYDLSFYYGSRLVQTNEGVPVGDPYEQFVGPTGPADNTYFTLATFKAQPTTNGAARLVNASGVTNGDFAWTLGNFTGQADDENIIKADSTDLSVGAWVRQGAQSILFQQSGGVRSDTETQLRYFVRPEQFASFDPDNSTAAVQAAHDSLPAEGGTILFDLPLYTIDYITVAKPNVTVRVSSNTTLMRYGSAGHVPQGRRGMFFIPNLLYSFFWLNHDGVIDLNGEGPTGIGIDGRIPNVYLPQNGAPFPSLAGPANAAVFALRSSHIRVSGSGEIKNSGESGMLLRNCGNVTVDGITFRNIGNYGIEQHFPNPATDGGTGTVPELGYMVIRNCLFEDIDDRSIGTGNGVGVGGGGWDAHGALPGCVYESLTFRRCIRGLWMEFPYTGTWLEGPQINNILCEDNQLNDLGAIGLRGGGLDNFEARDCGAPAELALYRFAVTDAYPSMASVYLSGDFSELSVGDNVRIIDSRTGTVATRTDGVVSTTAGVTTVTSATGGFTGMAGKRIGILGAGPSGIIHKTTIAAVNSDTSITLTDAAGTDIASSAKIAFGTGYIREGMVLLSGASASVGRIHVKAGASAGLTAEPPASAVCVQDIDDFVRLGAYNLVAPASGSSRPAGLRMRAVQGWTGKLLRDPGARITGFAAAEVGTYEYRVATIRPTKSLPTPDRVIAPSASANTYGDIDTLPPDTAVFADLLRGSVEAVGTFAGGETVTFKLQVFFADSADGPAVEIPMTAVGEQQFTAKHFALANPENLPFRIAALSMKSSAAGSAVTGKINLTCAQ